MRSGRQAANSVRRAAQIASPSRVFGPSATIYAALSREAAPVRCEPARQSSATPTRPTPRIESRDASPGNRGDLVIENPAREQSRLAVIAQGRPFSGKSRAEIITGGTDRVGEVLDELRYEDTKVKGESEASEFASTELTQLPNEIPPEAVAKVLSARVMWRPKDGADAIAESNFSRITGYELTMRTPAELRREAAQLLNVEGDEGGGDRKSLCFSHRGPASRSSSLLAPSRTSPSGS